MPKQRNILARHRSGWGDRVEKKFLTRLGLTSLVLLMVLLATGVFYLYRSLPKGPSAPTRENMQKEANSVLISLASSISNMTYDAIDEDEYDPLTAAVNAAKSIRKAIDHIVITNNDEEIITSTDIKTFGFFQKYDPPKNDTTLIFASSPIEYRKKKIATAHIGLKIETPESESLPVKKTVVNFAIVFVILGIVYVFFLVLLSLKPLAEFKLALADKASEGLGELIKEKKREDEAVTKRLTEHKREENEIRRRIESLKEEESKLKERVEPAKVKSPPIFVQPTGAQKIVRPTEKEVKGPPPEVKRISKPAPEKEKIESIRERIKKLEKRIDREH